jgi:hypothetical protein
MTHSTPTFLRQITRNEATFSFFFCLSLSTWLAGFTRRYLYKTGGQVSNPCFSSIHGTAITGKGIVCGLLSNRYSLAFSFKPLIQRRKKRSSRKAVGKYILENNKMLIY